MEPVAGVPFSSVQTPRKRGRWSAAEEVLLLRLCKSDPDWTAISDATGRTVEACKGHHYKLSGPKKARKRGRTQSWYDTFHVRFLDLTKFKGHPGRHHLQALHSQNRHRQTLRTDLKP